LVQIWLRCGERALTSQRDKILLARLTHRRGWSLAPLLADWPIDDGGIVPAQVLKRARKALETSRGSGTRGYTRRPAGWAKRCLGEVLARSSVVVLNNPVIRVCVLATGN